jgi:spermidine/putrescine transport system substrate-binding protein
MNASVNSLLSPFRIAAPRKLFFTVLSAVILSGCGQQIPGPSPFQAEKQPWWRIFGETISATNAPAEFEETTRSLAGFTNIGNPRKKLHLVLPDNLISPDILREYTKKSGIGFRITVVQSAEEIRRVVERNPAEIDLALVHLRVLQEFKEQGLLETLETTRLTNLRDLKWPVPVQYFFTRDWQFDPGNRFSVPYLWGSVGIAYNRTAVQGLRSFKELINLRSNSNIVQSNLFGRVTMLPDNRLLIGAALMAQGEDLNSTNRETIKRAAQLLVDQQPFLAGYGTNTSGYQMNELVPLLAKGHVVLAQILSGDATYAIEKNSQIDFAIPDEGFIFIAHSMVIPKGKPITRKREIEDFMNYLLNPVVAAAISNFSRFATTSQEAKKFLSRSVRNGPAYQVVEFEKLRFMGAIDRSTTALYHETWKELTNSVVTGTKRL